MSGGGVTRADLQMMTPTHLVRATYYKVVVHLIDMYVLHF